MVSVLELFSIGIGPSSSHTVGPMVAARRFVDALADAGELATVERVRVVLHGSLALTGRGHGTDTAVLLGLQGERPDAVDPDAAAAAVLAIEHECRLALAGRRSIAFDPGRDVVLLRSTRPAHPNTLDLEAFDGSGGLLRTSTYWSVGGGFVEEAGAAAGGVVSASPGPPPEPYPFATGAELLARARESGLSISGVVRANELAQHSEAGLDAGLDRIWAAMTACVERGLRTEGELPGGLRVQRRAAALARTLASEDGGAFAPMEWVNAWAMAVNEENAAGGRVVTAPTNGAAGILPAVLHHYVREQPDAGADGVRAFLLTAAAIGRLFKTMASISGAEMGCQGEVGSACAMAAAGLAERLGGTAAQVEHAAEIALEHNLGLTCDPVGGLVQVPCIERNGIAAVKAINAAHMAVRTDGRHIVSLDQAIEAMRETGRDMSRKYKETSLGGLAVSVVEC